MEMYHLPFRGVYLYVQWTAEDGVTAAGATGRIDPREDGRSGFSGAPYRWPSHARKRVLPSEKGWLIFAYSRNLDNLSAFSMWRRRVFVSQKKTRITAR